MVKSIKNLQVGDIVYAVSNELNDFIIYRVYKCKIHEDYTGCDQFVVELVKEELYDPKLPKKISDALVSVRFKIYNICNIIKHDDNFIYYFNLEDVEKLLNSDLKLRMEIVKKQELLYQKALKMFKREI